MMKCKSDQVWWCNIIIVFELFQKLDLLVYASQFMTSRKKLQKFEYLENDKRPLCWKLVKNTIFVLFKSYSFIESAILTFKF